MTHLGNSKKLRNADKNKKYELHEGLPGTKEHNVELNLGWSVGHFPGKRKMENVGKIRTIK